MPLFIIRSPKRAGELPAEGGTQPRAPQPVLGLTEPGAPHGAGPGAVGGRGAEPGRGPGLGPERGPGTGQGPGMGPGSGPGAAPGPDGAAAPPAAAMAAPPQAPVMAAPQPPPSPPARRCRPSVEPLLFLATLSLGLQVPLATQYLWDRLGAEHGYSGPNGSSPAGCGNDSGSPDPLRQVGAPPRA